jgi:hypothetical protein
MNVEAVIIKRGLARWNSTTVNLEMRIFGDKQV